MIMKSIKSETIKTKLKSVDFDKLKTKSGEVLEIAKKSSGEITKETLNSVSNAANISVKKAKEVAGQTKDKIQNIKPEDVLSQAIKVPGVRIDRKSFLIKELQKYCPDEQVFKAIETNPAKAGIPREKINEIADYVIDYETNKVSTVSFASGLPGGLAMIATIPADTLQYFGFMMRVMQKLSYLYGFSDFELSENEISDETMNLMLLFFGVMFGINGANQGIKIVAETTSKKISKSLAQKALTQTAYYPIVKKVATALGFKMSKDVFAKGVSKVVPVIGGVVSGGVTYLTFKPCAKKLKDTLKVLRLSDSEYYKETLNEGE